MNAHRSGLNQPHLGEQDITGEHPEERANTMASLEPDGWPVTAGNERQFALDMNNVGSGLQMGWYRGM